VFLPGMEESVFPLTRALYDEDALEEERRLAYVGITRAKKKLFMSYANTRTLYNERHMNALSRFVEEIPPRLIRTGSRRGEAGRVPPPTGFRRQPTPASGYGRQLPSYGKANYVRSAARDVKPVIEYAVGDRVIHRSYGAGVVRAVEGQGAEQVVKIDFGPLGEREFNAAAAPITKVGK